MSTVRNFVQLVGNLGRKPEMKHFENGNSLAKFSLATSYFYTNKAGEKVQDTQWHNIVVWGELAKYVEENLDKGLQVKVEGRINYNIYEAKDGSKRTFTEIIADKIELVERTHLATA